jgi:DNA-binding response OmpR family regulator
MARVLIVDDDPDIVEAVRLCLEHEGHEVISAGNREDGLRLGLEGGADLLILDIMMVEPDDGFVLAHDLRRQGFDKPILVMTSISRVTGLDYTKESALTPVDDFVEKPVDASVLVSKIGALLDR